VAAALEGCVRGAKVGGECLKRRFGARVRGHDLRGGASVRYESRATCRHTRLDAGPRTTFSQGLYVVGGRPWWPLLSSECSRSEGLERALGARVWSEGLERGFA
jgi:hypothetical protein